MTTNLRPGPEISSLYAFGSAIYLFHKTCHFVLKPGTKHFVPVSCKRLQKFHTDLSSYRSEFVPVSCKYPLTFVQKSGILPFVTTYHPAVKNLKQLLMQEWSLIHNQPMLKNIYKTPPIISYRRGKSLTDILVRAKLWRHISQRRNRKDTWGSQSRSVMIFSQQSLNCVKFRTKSAAFPFESSRPPCLIFLGIWNTADFVSGLQMPKISGDVCEIVYRRIIDLLATSSKSKIVTESKSEESEQSILFRFHLCLVAY